MYRGTEGIVTALHDVPNGEVWTREKIRDLREYIESYIIIGAVSMSSSSTVDARASLKENRTVNAGAVSYTHLDVYKRQPLALVYQNRYMRSLKRR